MYKHTNKPIIMPLSNPTANAEAKPADLLQWTHGQALIATGSPFAPVTYQNKTYTIAQCNNAYIFPGIGLGSLISKAKFVSDGMLWAACEALSECAPLSPSGQIESLLPPLTQCKAISKKIGMAVAQQAIKENLSTHQSASGQPLDLDYEFNQCFWEPKYHHIRLIK